jgi:hypothetical protein
MWIRIAVLALISLSGCEQADSIELGQECAGSAQCKDPADTCLEIQGKKRCSMACTKDHKCPEGYACPVTDPAKKDQGMCLPESEIGPHIVRAYK